MVRDREIEREDGNRGRRIKCLKKRKRARPEVRKSSRMILKSLIRLKLLHILLTKTVRLFLCPHFVRKGIKNSDTVADRDSTEITQ